ncbi:MAG: prepilin-type N-terminal cleavage/methylation domain-containing protein [Candidatus Eisenbacteria bacterium]|nr:prepilin-type N-terminal cleavage/methylation domain-containing protein [Candidatus Eisenbacteria bacterium]
MNRLAATAGTIRQLLKRVRRTMTTDRGVTMIEILVSIVVLSILIVPIFDSMVSGRTLAMHRGEERMALRLVERKAEQLLKAGYGAVGSDADVSSVCMTSGVHPTDPSIVVSTRGDDDAANDLLGDMTWSVVPVIWSSPGDSVRAKLVEVKLRWPQGAPRDSVTVSTIVGA